MLEIYSNKSELVSRFTFKIKLISHMIEKVNNYKI